MPNARRFLVGFVVAAVVSNAPAQSTTADAAPQPFEGVVYDIDYLGGETQILLRPCEPSANCIGTATNTRIRTSSALLQRLFETSLLAQRRVHGTFDPSEPEVAQTVVLESTAIKGSDDHVRSVACHAVADSCTASFFGQQQDVTVQDARAVGVLCVAITKNVAVQYLRVGPGGFLERVKVNEP